MHPRAPAILNAFPRFSQDYVRPTFKKPAVAYMALFAALYNEPKCARPRDIQHGATRDPLTTVACCRWNDAIKFRFAALSSRMAHNTRVVSYLNKVGLYLRGSPRATIIVKLHGIMRVCICPSVRPFRDLLGNQAASSMKISANSRRVLSRISMLPN